MNKQIITRCPNCLAINIKKNGKKSCGKQNYQCKNCRRQFIHQLELSYQGCLSQIDAKIRLMLVRSCSIADIVAIEGVSKTKVLSVLLNSKPILKPKKKHYHHLEVDEFWTYVGSKRNKIWLIYAYDKLSGEIVAFVWGKRDLATAKQLRERLMQMSISFDHIHCDKWDSFLVAFELDNKLIGKQFTVGIEGNNNRIRHRIRRAFRKTCCFSKRLINHFKAFDLVFHYINYGWV